MEARYSFRVCISNPGDGKKIYQKLQVFTKTTFEIFNKLFTFFPLANELGIVFAKGIESNPLTGMLRIVSL